MENKTQEKNDKYLMPVSIILASLLIAGAWVYNTGKQVNGQSAAIGASALGGKADFPTASDEVATQSVDVVLPVKWGGLGEKMVKSGVIDANKFEELYAARGGLSPEIKKLLYQKDNDSIIINEANSDIVLNLLWALGLSNKNLVLENGPMVDPRYGGAGNFASTGGWTLAQGNAMDHYSRHEFVVLTAEQQRLVERVSSNIYRPCCNNSTYFPDCNHGMAMLGLLELMAANNVGEEEMYRVALAVNSLWFPGTYDTIKTLFDSEGVDWNRISPKEVLGKDYSSASGFRQILSKVKPVEKNNGSGCGVQ
jgi:hypothetical protein